MTRPWKMRPEFDEAVAELNDQWGVDSWSEQTDGTLLVVLDDGDEVIVQEDGSWEVQR